ncbi:uncharacterized protein TM35_000671200, partial [Trypanosoma theileri]
AAESEWLTCGAGSRVSACGKYADLCRQRTARAATTTQTTRTTVNAGQPKAVMAIAGGEGNMSVESVFEEYGDGFYAKRKTGGGSEDHSGGAQQQLVNRAENERDTVTELTQPTLAGHSGEAQLKVGGFGESGRDESEVTLPTTVAHRPEVSGMGVGDNHSQDLAGDSLGPGESAVHSSTIDQQNNKGPTSDPAQDAGRNTGSLPDGSEAAGRTSSSQGATINDSSSTENQVTEGSTSTTDNVSLGVSTDSPDSSNPSQASGTTAPNSISAADSQETTATNESTDTSGSGADMGEGAKTETEENTSTTQPSPEDNTTEAPTTTLSSSPVPNTEINSSIAPIVQKNANANVDSSVNPVWMRTAAPLMIVVVLFSATVY